MGTTGLRQLFSTKMPAHWQSVAVCVTGSARTFKLPCTFARTIENVAEPLGAHVFLSVNVPKASMIEDISNYTARIFTTSMKSKLVRIQIYHDVGLYNETLTCADGLGRQQAEGMGRCAKMAFEYRTSGYEYMIRIRTDLYVPFRLQSLPLHPPDGIYVGFLGKMCDTGARWMDDKFAILPGTKAQTSYMLGYAHDFCRRNCTSAVCRAPECKIGYSTGVRGIRAMDLRHFGSSHGPTIVRTNCDSDLSGRWWVHFWRYRPLVVQRADFRYSKFGLPLR